MRKKCIKCYCYQVKEVWNSIDTVTLTRLFQEEFVVEKQKESEGEEG